MVRNWHDRTTLSCSSHVWHGVVNKYDAAALQKQLPLNNRSPAIYTSEPSPRQNLDAQGKGATRNFMERVVDRERKLGVEHPDFAHARKLLAVLKSVAPTNECSPEKSSHCGPIGHNL